MTNKLNALCEVNKKISEIQKKYRIRMSNEYGKTFNFDIPESDKVWMKNLDIGIDTVYKRIQLVRSGGKNIHMTVFYGKEGSVVNKHIHEESHLIICIDGLAEFIIEDESYTISKGKSIYVDSNEWHQINFINSTKLIIIYI